MSAIEELRHYIDENANRLVSVIFPQGLLIDALKEHDRLAARVTELERDAARPEASSDPGVGCPDLCGDVCVRDQCLCYGVTPAPGGAK